MLVFSPLLDSSLAAAAMRSKMVGSNRSMVSVSLLISPVTPLSSTVCTGSMVDGGTPSTPCFLCTCVSNNRDMMRNSIFQEKNHPNYQKFLSNSRIIQKEIRFLHTCRPQTARTTWLQLNANCPNESNLSYQSSRNLIKDGDQELSCRMYHCDAVRCVGPLTDMVPVFFKQRRCYQQIRVSAEISLSCCPEHHQ